MEQKLLCSVLTGGDFNKLKIKGIKENYFVEALNKSVFLFLDQFYTEYNKIPSMETLKEKFPTFEYVEVTDPLAFYIDQVIEQHSQAVLQQTLSDSIKSLQKKNSSEAVSILAKGINIISGINSKGNEVFVEDTEEREKLYLLRKEKLGLIGIPTGISVIDENLGGSRVGDLGVIAARTGIGKTFLLLRFGITAWNKGYKVLLLTKEMTAVDLAVRFDSLHFGLNYSHLRKGILQDHKEKEYFAGLRELREHQKKTWKILGSNVGGLRELEAEVEEFSPSLLLVDAGYLIREEEWNKLATWEKAMCVGQGLKKIAGHVPVWVTWQMNKGGSKEDMTPGNLIHGESLGYDCTYLIGLWQSLEMKKSGGLVGAAGIKSRESDRFAFQYIDNHETGQLTIVRQDNFSLNEEGEKEERVTNF